MWVLVISAVVDFGRRKSVNFATESTRFHHGGKAHRSRQKPSPEIKVVLMALVALSVNTGTSLTAITEYDGMYRNGPLLHLGPLHYLHTVPMKLLWYFSLIAI